MRMAAICLLSVTPYAFAQVVYTATLSGAAEIPPNASTATGTATVTYSPATSSMVVSTSFSGVISTTTVAHIHCCTLVAGTTNAGVATQTPSFAGFPGGVSAAMYTNTFDMTLASSYNASFVTASGGLPQALDRLLAGMGNGTAYFNLHSVAFAGGEIRGNLIEQAVFRNGFE